MFSSAEAYDRFMGRWSRLLAPRLVEFAVLAEGARVLDVGSGTGSLAFAIAGRDSRASVIGIDPSPQYAAFANSNNADVHRVSFDVGDAQDLRFPSASFDAGLSLLVLNFIPHPAKAIQEIRRVVRPGGTVAAAVWDYGAGMRMLRAFWDAAVRVDPGAEMRDENRMPLCREGELASLWRQCGLDDIREQPIDIEMRFASFADYWDPFLLGQGPAGSYVNSLESAPLQRLRDEIKRGLALAAEDAPFVLPARAWAVRGIAASE